MKKLLTGLFGIILTMCFVGIANACDIEGLYDNYQAVYMPSTNTWTTGGMADDRIVLTKKTSTGSGSYSEYYNSDGTLAIALDSNFEFIKDGKLIAVDNANLKYYEVKYEDGKFTEKPLCETALAAIFPKAQIVKISEFQKNKITVKKLASQDKIVVLLNDTDKSFYKYSCNPNVQNKDIKGLLKLTTYDKIKFSHYGEKKNLYTIKVKVGIECACKEKCNCLKEGEKCTCGENCNCKEKCNCLKEGKKCTCGENCNCKEKCNCLKEGEKCICGENCNCKEKCNCLKEGKKCTCGENCNCKEKCNCTDDCKCGPNCECKK